MYLNYITRNGRYATFSPFYLLYINLSLSPRYLWLWFYSIVFLFAMPMLHCHSQYCTCCVYVWIYTKSSSMHDDCQTRARRSSRGQWCSLELFHGCSLCPPQPTTPCRCCCCWPIPLLYCYYWALQSFSHLIYAIGRELLSNPFNNEQRILEPLLIIYR